MIGQILDQIDKHTKGMYLYLEGRHNNNYICEMATFLMPTHNQAPFIVPTQDSITQIRAQHNNKHTIYARFLSSNAHSCLHAYTLSSHHTMSCTITCQHTHNHPLASHPTTPHQTQQPPKYPLLFLGVVQQKNQKKNQ